MVLSLNEDFKNFFPDSSLNFLFFATNIKVINGENKAVAVRSLEFSRESDLCSFCFRASSYVFLWRTKVQCMPEGSSATYRYLSFYSEFNRFREAMVFSQKDDNKLFYILPGALFPPLRTYTQWLRHWGPVTTDTDITGGARLIRTHSGVANEPGWSSACGKLPEAERNSRPPPYADSASQWFCYHGNRSVTGNASVA